RRRPVGRAGRGRSARNAAPWLGDGALPGGVGGLGGGAMKSGAADWVVVAACSWAVGGCVTSRGAPAAQSATASLPAPHVAAGQLDARLLLGELPARASRLGAGPPSLVASEQAVANGWVGGFVDVPRDDWVLGYARGSSSIDDIDAAIYSEEGTTLAVDEGRDVHPTVMLCSPHPERVYLAAHVVEGEGL